MTGYEVQRLVPGGAITETVGGTIETDGPWLIVRDAAGQAVRCWPTHVIIDVRPASGD